MLKYNTFAEFASDVQNILNELSAESEPLFDDCLVTENIEPLDPDMLMVWEDR